MTESEVSIACTAGAAWSIAAVLPGSWSIPTSRLPGGKGGILGERPGSCAAEAACPHGRPPPGALGPDQVPYEDRGLAGEGLLKSIVLGRGQARRIPLGLLGAQPWLDALLDDQPRADERLDVLLVGVVVLGHLVPVALRVEQRCAPAEYAGDERVRGGHDQPAARPQHAGQLIAGGLEVLQVAVRQPAHDRVEAGVLERLGGQLSDLELDAGALGPRLD